MNRKIRLVLSVLLSYLLTSIFVPQVIADTSQFITQQDYYSGDVTIFGCKSQCPKNLVIPDSIGGWPVTQIWAFAFRGARIDSVKIPNSVTLIGDSAFEDNNLRTIYIPSSVHQIDKSAFADNSELHQVAFEGDAPLLLLGDAFSGTSYVWLPKLSELRVRMNSEGWGSKWSGVKVNRTTFISAEITGKPRVHQTLSAVVKKWRYSLSPTFKYQWFACTTEIYDPFVGESTPSTKRIPKTCKAIENAKQRNLKLTNSQKGKYVTVRVTGQLYGWATTSLIAWTTSKISK